VQPLIQTLAQKLALKPAQVQATVELVDAGNTLPFIARYRKEATGGLDEEQLRTLIEELKSYRALEERREAILKSLREQDKLTAELERAVAAAESLTRLEDLYLPHRPKRKTRASIARERGLGPLAERILAQAPAPLQGTPEELAGARDIVAEAVAEHPDVRRLVREKALRFATLIARKIEKAEDPRGVFATYYEFTCPVGRLRPHQTLALDRGEHEKILRLSLEIPERDWREAPRFYIVIAAAILVGLGVVFLPVEPIKALIWSAVLNGVIVVPIIAAMMVVASRRAVMGAFTANVWQQVLGWATLAVMAAAAFAMFMLM
jgi:uncharacterized protein